MLAAGTNSGIYKLLLVLHIVTIVVGIGTVTLNGLYGAESKKRPGPGGRGVAEANLAVSGVAEWFIYAIPVTGIVMVLTSDDAWDFSQTWIWAALLVYAAAIGVAHAVLFPNARRIVALLAEMEQQPPPAGGPPPQVARLEVLGAQQAKAGTVMHVLTVVLIALMVWKPGV
jgi:hypothetical protein